MPTAEQPTPNLDSPYDTKSLAKYLATQRTGDPNAEPSPIDHLQAVRFQLSAANDAENAANEQQQQQPQLSRAQVLRNFAMEDDDEAQAPSPMPLSPTPTFSPIQSQTVSAPMQTQRQGPAVHPGLMRGQLARNPFELLARLVGRRQGLR